MTSGKKVASGIFVGSKDSESDKGDRIESLFNISFWAKEGAIEDKLRYWTAPFKWGKYEGRTAIGKVDPCYVHGGYLDGLYVWWGC